MIKVIHRDIKPENIFRVKNKKTLEIRIGDFGVSK
jgi:serine/threonine protein kinase